MMPLGRNILQAGQDLSNIRLDLEIEGQHLRLEGVELTVIEATAIPDFYAPLTEPTYSSLPGPVA